MADRTTITLYTVDLPEEDEQKLLEALEPELDQPTFPDDFYWHDMPVGTVGYGLGHSILDVFAEVAKANPEAEIRLWEDPAYEHLGYLRYWRGERAHEGECDAEGNFVVTENQIPWDRPQDVLNTVYALFGRTKGTK